MDIKGRTAIVTGGTGGLGGRLARKFAEAGANIALVYRESHDKANARAEELRALGVTVVPIAADLSTPEGIAGMVERTEREFDSIDVLVNNAAVNMWIPFSDLDALTLDIWDEIIRMNLTGPFLCAKAVAKSMKADGQGRIINISSGAGLRPGGSSIAYAVSKAGLIHLTRCLAVALAPEVLVNCIAPGMLEETRMTANLDPEFAEQSRQNALLKRAASKSDVADQAVGFARTDTITGQTILIDAGVFFH
ncbi:MAG: SDR family oxidoreductase [Chloroflexota bacterium]|jgi:3-oxoacyl-[acyl-carrier protein] reductase|nr:SDR family oxidoreductase [Chloroflexota bacterium]MDP6509069.1 SDR family oxidoreductase [Chloroflexota bacterium]MDP6757603.1 SDR family oxidoreductase [Chloroflexota bacterium]